MRTIDLTDEKWDAIVGNDSSYDGKFYYAVVTTGIFCRPSCKSKTPARANVRVFSNPGSARAEHYRPCKRCKPDGRQQPMEEWVGHIVRLIETRYSEPLNLNGLAEMIHGSPFHVHRSFKRIMGGITIHEYVQKTRIAAAKRVLAESNNSMAEIALMVGIPNSAHFTTLFRKITGLTPTDYRRTIRETKIKKKGDDRHGAAE